MRLVDLLESQPCGADHGVKAVTISGGRGLTASPWGA
jgi:hypothetical protein